MIERNVLMCEQNVLYDIFDMVLVWAVKISCQLNIVYLSSIRSAIVEYDSKMFLEGAFLLQDNNFYCILLGKYILHISFF